jgi:hypothetical protein
MLTLVCSLIWLLCTYQKQWWGYHFTLMAASCAMITGLDLFFMGMSLPFSIAEIDKWLNLVFIALGVGTIIHLHKTEKLNIV